MTARIHVVEIAHSLDTAFNVVNAIGSRINQPQEAGWLLTLIFVLFSFD